MRDAVLVTGGTGFIGSATVAALRAAGRDVVALGSADGDIAARATLERFHDAGIGSVIHCAGRTFVPDSWTDPVGFLTANMTGTMQVLEFCRQSEARLIHISAYVYGRPESLPIAETAPIRANNPYALSKHMAEQACRFYADQHGVAVTILRPFNVYGPGQPEKFLVPTILSQIAAGKAVEMLDLEPRRDYVFLADLVDAILLAEAKRPAASLTLNIGSGVSHSVAEIVSAAQAVAGTALAVTSRNMRREQEIDDVRADISLARSVLDWKPRVSLMDGIGRLFRLHESLPG